MNKQFFNKKICQIRRRLGNSLATGSYLGPIPAQLREKEAAEDKVVTDEDKPTEFVWNNHTNTIREKLHVDLVEEVGHGAFGKVFACEQVSETFEQKEKFAVKVIAPKFVTPAKRKIWKRHARAEVYWLDKMDHENIVKYYGFTFLKHPTMDFKCYVAIKMELLDCSLQNILVDPDNPEKTCLLTLDEVTRLGLQIATALNWMHQHGFVHHDIKPPNIMAVRFDSKSEDFHQQLRVCDWKITDVGLLKRYRDPMTVKEKKFFGGSKLYMDNRKRNKQPYIPSKADVFAFAMTLVEALIGRDRLMEDLDTQGNMFNVAGEFLREFNEETQAYNRDHNTSLALQRMLVEPEDRRVNIEDVLEYFK